MISSRGFSVPEMVVIIFLSSVVFLGISQIYITYNSSYLYQNASINASLSAASFVNETADMALQASNIVASRTVSGTLYTTGSTTVILEIPSIDNDGDIITSTYDYAILFGSTTEAYRIMDAAASSARLDGTKMFSEVVSNLTFTYDNASPTVATALTVDITNQTAVKQQVVSTHLKQTVYLRNKQ